MVINSIIIIAMATMLTIIILYIRTIRIMIDSVIVSITVIILNSLFIPVFVVVSHMYMYIYIYIYMYTHA